jgi:hypothetical protein
LDPVDVVLRQTLRSGRQWFETFGQALSENIQDPVALIVPSVIVPEYNVVLYPRATNFEPELVRIESVEEFEFDPRLFDTIVAV